MEITVTPKTKFNIQASIMLEDIEQLAPICRQGLPKTIPREMKESLEILVCLCLNPLRPLEPFFGNQS